MRPFLGLTLLAALAAGAACGRRQPAEGAPGADSRAAPATGNVVPGIGVLLTDSIHLIRGRRIGLITNHTGIDARGTSDIDLLSSDPRARAAGVRLVTLFSPEHGIRGTEDRENVESGVDAKTGLPIHSLYGRETIGPPDSTLQGLDALVVDLQDIGTRTWTYVGVVLYSMRAAARRGIPILVLDRPNPITAEHVDGPFLDTTLANPEDPAPGRPGQAYALYPTPLRHGLTMGELARMFNGELRLGADLRVIPMRGYRRRLWWDETGLPWVRPSPNMPSPTSALIYPAIVPFEASNVSVGRGTADAFQHIGAPWLDGRRVAALLEERDLGGVRFEAERFTPRGPTDRKYDGQELGGVRVVVTDRDRVQVGRVGAALLWALVTVHRDSLRITDRAFDLRFGSTAGREALMAGGDPDEVIDRQLPAVVAWQQHVRRYQLYR